MIKAMTISLDSSDIDVAVSVDSPVERASIDMNQAANVDVAVDSEVDLPGDYRVRRIRDDFQTPLGLARNAAFLHNKLDLSEHPPVSIGNWIPAPHSEGRDGRVPPFHVPDPAGDAYLAGLNVAALDKDEEALSPRLMPGWVDHLKAIGVVARDVVIHEVDFNVVETLSVENGSAVHKLAGFPHTDILSQAEAQGVRLKPGQLVSATFPTPFVREQVSQLGGVLVQDSDTARTNNKHEFRQAAERYGFSVFPEVSVSSEAELLEHTQELRRVCERARSFGANPKYVARLKDPCSSGGDGVRGIEAPISDDAMRTALDGILGGIERSYQLAEYGDRLMALRWRDARKRSFPRPLVLEHDATTVGEVLFNGSFMVEIHDDGRYAVPRYFGQKTDREGSFRGGYTIDKTSTQWAKVFTESADKLLTESIDGVVRYWHGELGVRGMAGVDFMLVRRYEDDAIVPYLFDPNVRPTINSVSNAIAAKVEQATGFTAWENMNGWAPTELTAMSDFENLLFGVDEENISYGAHDLVSSGHLSDVACMVVAEAGQVEDFSQPFSVGFGRKGRVAFEATIYGALSHAAVATPETNAINRAAAFVRVLESLSFPTHHALGSTRVVPHALLSEASAFSAPGECLIRFSALTTPGVTGESVASQIRERASLEGLRVDLKLVERKTPYGEAYEVPLDHPWIREVTERIIAPAEIHPAYFSSVADENVFARRLNIPVMTLGPIGAGDHTKDEWVRLSSLDATRRAYEEILLLWSSSQRAS